MHVSDIGGLTVIDSSNARLFSKPYTPDGCSTTGFRARDFSQFPLCGIQGTTEFPRDMILTEKEIRERVEEQDRKESSLWHILKRGPKIWRNQSPSNYCWFFATMHALQAARIWENLPAVLLSPFSGGCLADSFANRGGWGPQALKQLIDFGVCEEKYWPSAPIDGSANVETANNNAIRNGRQYVTPEMKANALKYRVKEWFDFRSRDFLAKASAVVRGIPVSSGYNWMGHQMCTVRIITLRNGGLGCVDLDSYGRGGDFSEQALSASQGSGDDMVAPRMAT